MSDFDRDLERHEIPVAGLDGIDDVERIETTAIGVEGVAYAEANLAEGTLVLRALPEAVTEVEAALRNVGYDIIA